MKSGDVVGGKYRVTERLGAGGMGTVWEAINERTGRKVALKLILHPTEELRNRLRREALACGRIEHRNIVQVYDVDETSAGDPFLVMQLLTGQTLGELLASRRRLEPSLVARIGRDIASALSAAHKAKVIHRDLKPANIFLHREEDGVEGDEDGFVVKVVDFGVAKMLASADGAGVVTSALVGSPAYMSPEQLCAAKDLDHRTDIWSLGIVLYEMLTGNRPFKGSLEDVIKQILTAPIQPPSHHVRQLPRAFDELVARCLERDRGKRIHSAADLARMLDALKDEGVEVRVPSSSSFPMGRLAMGSGAEASPIPGSGRPAVGSLPAAVDDGDLAATVLHPKNAALANRVGGEGNASADDGPNAAPTRTRILSPEEPIASPMPEWRRAVAARRQATPLIAGASSEEVRQGGTVAISPDSVVHMAMPPESVAQVVAAMPGVGVTTTTAPLVQGAPGVGNVSAVAAEGAPLKRRGSRRFVVTIGVGVAAVLACAGFVSTRFVSAAAPQGVAPEVAPNVAAPMVVPPPAPPSTTTPATPTTPPTTQEPKAPQIAPGADSGLKAPKSSPPSTPGHAPTNKVTTTKTAPATTPMKKASHLPSCTYFRNKGCR